MMMGLVVVAVVVVVVKMTEASWTLG